jgi:phosphoribosylformylglycinamidine synthase PurS subunit
MTYTVEIKVMPLKELLDPQGKAVLGGLANLGLSGIEDVRVGKNITVQVTADSVDQAKGLARTAAEKLLANPVMEYFELECRPA